MTNKLTNEQLKAISTGECKNNCEDCVLANICPSYAIGHDWYDTARDMAQELLVLRENK